MLGQTSYNDSQCNASCSAHTTPVRPLANLPALPTNTRPKLCPRLAPPPLPARSNLKHSARNNDEPRANRDTQNGAVADSAATPRCAFARVTPLIQFAITSSFSDRSNSIICHQARAASVATCPDARTYERTRACTLCLRRARAHTHWTDAGANAQTILYISTSPHVKRARPHA